MVVKGPEDTFPSFDKVELKLSVVVRATEEAFLSFSDDYPEGCCEQPGGVRCSNPVPGTGSNK